MKCTHCAIGAAPVRILSLYILLFLSVLAVALLLRNKD